MDSKKVRDAFELLSESILLGEFKKTEKEWESLSVVLDLAESVLAIAGKMPRKKSAEECRCDDALCNHLPILYYNEALDACTLAFAGMIPDNKQFGEEYDQNSNCDSNYVYGWNACRDAILSAMKGGGE